MKNRYKISIATNIFLIAILALVISFSVSPSSVVPIFKEKYSDAIYRGNENNKNISLMFNVYENTDTVNSILNILNEYNVKATFFVGGCWADDNGNTLCRMVKEGFEIANHGYFHKDHNKLNYEQNYQEINLTNKIINGLCGETPKLFAPPSGSYCKNTLESASDLDMSVIMWSKDTIDWRDKDTEKVIKRATKDLKNGDLILMHPKEHTLKALPTIIESVLNCGFNLVTVSQNIQV